MEAQAAAQGIAYGFMHKATWEDGREAVLYTDGPDVYVQYLDGWSAGVIEAVTTRDDVKFITEFLEPATAIEPYRLPVIIPDLG